MMEGREIDRNTTCFLLGLWTFLRGSCSRGTPALSREKQFIQPVVITVLGKRPGQTRGFGALKITMNSGLADATTARDLVLQQAELAQPQKFLDFQH